MKRRFLPRIVTGEIEFAQAYSEPDAGSDLANLRSSAALIGGEYVVTGQKLYASLFHRAEFCVVAVRSDPQAPKYGGISLLIVDVDTPGIEMRPLWAIGDPRTNVAFFDGVKVPVDDLIGEPGRGWDYLRTTLGSERLTASSINEVRALYNDLSDYIRAQGLAADPTVRQTMAQLTVEMEVLDVLTLRALWRLEAEGELRYESNQLKVFASELKQRLAGLGIQLVGHRAQATDDRAPLEGPYARVRGRSNAFLRRWRQRDTTRHHRQPWAGLAPQPLALDLAATLEQADLRATARSLLAHHVSLDRLFAIRAESPPLDRGLWDVIVKGGWLDAITSRAGLEEAAILAWAAGRVLAPIPLVSALTALWLVESLRDQGNPDLTAGLAQGRIPSLIGGPARLDEPASYWMVSPETALQTMPNSSRRSGGRTFSFQKARWQNSFFALRGPWTTSASSFFFETPASARFRDRRPVSSERQTSKSIWRSRPPRYLESAPQRLQLFACFRRSQLSSPRPRWEAPAIEFSK